MTEMEARELMRKELKEEKRLLIESVDSETLDPEEVETRIDEIEFNLNRIERYDMLHMSAGRRGVKSVGILSDVRNVFQFEGFHDRNLNAMVIAWAALMGKAIDKRFSVEEDGQQDLFTDVL